MRTRRKSSEQRRVWWKHRRANHQARSADISTITGQRCPYKVCLDHRLRRPLPHALSLVQDGHGDDDTPEDGFRACLVLARRTSATLAHPHSVTDVGVPG